MRRVAWVRWMASLGGRRLAIVAEDEHVRLFLLGLFHCAESRGATSGRWSVIATDLTHGCRQGTLRSLVERNASRCELVVVGADVYRADHTRRVMTHRQKEQRLREMIGAVSCDLCIVAAQPCVEAWLLAAGSALVEALEMRLDCTFRGPARWPRPANERQAKEDLARVLREGTGFELARRGFEYAEDVLRRCNLDNVPNDSLRSAFRSLTQALGC